MVGWGYAIRSFLTVGVVGERPFRQAQCKLFTSNFPNFTAVVPLTETQAQRATPTERRHGCDQCPATAQQVHAN